MAEMEIGDTESQDWVDVQEETCSKESAEHHAEVDMGAEQAPSPAESAEHEHSQPEVETGAGAPAQITFSDASSEHSVEHGQQEALAPPEVTGVAAEAVCDDVPPLPHVDTTPISEASLPQRQWSQTECHMNDIRYAEKTTACVPHRVVRKKFKILVTGQPETGRTTTIKNLFASIVQDPEWAPKDVSKLTMHDFRTSPEAFTTAIDDCVDTAGHMSITYTIQETPGLKGDPAIAAEALRTYMHRECEAYADQEAQLGIPREELKDGRVDAVLYFLPTNARIGESDIDFEVINALADYAPVIPLMCKADCLEEEEILQRKGELERLHKDGLRVYSFPADVVAHLTDAIHGLSRSSDESDEASCSKQAGPAFRLPFNIVSGTHVDMTVHKYWFVRKYRWAECEAYRTSNSDLRLLRQLLLEDGFWAIKDEADARYRLLRREAVSAAPVSANNVCASSAVETAPSASAAASAGEGPSWAPLGDITSGELRQSGRGSRFVPSWLTPPAPASDSAKAAQPAPVHPLVGGAANLRSAVSTRGIGASVRPAGTAAHKGNWRLSTSPPTNDSQHFLSINSDDTEFNTMPGASALAALAADAPSSHINPVRQAAPPSAMIDEPQHDDSKCVKATVQDVQRGMSRNYRLTLKLEGEEKILSLRIGETEGSAIASALRSNSTSRPSAYDATAELLKSLGCRVERVQITECSNTIFYARVFAVNLHSGKRVDIDARPSDAINLALRHSVDVYVHKEVVERFAK